MELIDAVLGRVDTVVDLQAMRGLRSREREHVREFDTHRHTFFEAVIGAARGGATADPRAACVRRET